MNTYVLVGGAWIGAWAWQQVAARLREAGHDVYPLSLTGLGERAHLGGPHVGLGTHITDVVNLIVLENLRDVVLVGHSYAGTVIAGAADRIPERIGQLVYVDSGPPTDGTALIDTYPPEVGVRLEQQVREHGDGWGLPLPSWNELVASGSSLDGLGDTELESMRERAVPHPFGTFTERLRLRNPERARIPKVAILCSFSKAEVDEMIALGHPAAAAFDDPEWEFVELPTGHWPMLSIPEQLGDELAEMRAEPLSACGGGLSAEYQFVGARLL